MLRFKVPELTLVVCIAASIIAGSFLSQGNVLALGEVDFASEVSDVSGPAETTIPIPGFEITGVGGTIVRVMLKAPETVDLSMTETSGLSGKYDDSGWPQIDGFLHFEGTIDDVNAALATLQYSTDTLGPVTLQATIAGADQYLNPDTNHVYSRVTGSSFNFAAARSAASSQITPSGVSGYLANINSDAEATFINQNVNLPTDSWIGGTDSDSEGVWKWADGPEAGTQFWQGAGADSGGVSVDDAYTNWSGASQPDNSDSTEDCITWSNAYWNDVDCNSGKDYAIVEFSNEDGSIPLPSQTVTLTGTGPEVEDQDISTCAQLLAIDDDIDNRFRNYTLTDDIDCSGVENFTPIGNGDNNWAAQGYRGVFDGDGHTISNLTIDATGEDYAGLFAQLDGGTIENLKLEDGSVLGDGVAAGGLVGYIKGGRNAASPGYISKVCSNLTITGNGGGMVHTGGLVGKTKYADISYSCATGNVSGTTHYAGGLVGYNEEESIIASSYATGDVDSSEYSGGLVGYDDDELQILDAYSLGNLTSTDYCGGIIAYATQVTAFRTYFAGTLDCPNPDGLVAYADSTYEFHDSFWDLKDGANPASTYADTYGATGGRSTDQMKDSATYIDDGDLEADWDFDTMWQIEDGVNNGYPHFRWTISSDSPDSDSDNISNDIEDAAPNSGDANNDGTADSEQAHVASSVDPVTGEYAVLEVDEQCTIESLDIISESDVSSEGDTDFSYPAGLMDFRIDCGENGFTATIKQYYYDVSGDFIVRKFKPSTGYFAIDNATVSDQTIDSRSVKVASYQVTDGSSLDLDDAVNGSIEDPAGLAQAVTDSSDPLANTGQNTHNIELLATILLTSGLAIATYSFNRRRKGTYATTKK